ncbi:uncharacterized protein LOC101450183 [Ceratitis capitata]|uniref:uncharacterized protein LOC101450183 n=1 Tax=Ceratitis capitata TaxID=7213 RepID=UPI00032A0456|nr:uncharacterized protein LOC101450183 [Ceratitis capitata]
MDEPTPLSRKESEYIDHDLPLQSLLAPTYLRDANNYLIDFMEHVPGTNVNGLTTSANAISTTSSSDVGAFNLKISQPVSLTSDLHFPNTLFHYRPTQSDVAAVNNVSGVTEATLNALNAPTQQPTTPLPLVLSSSNSSNSSSNNGSAYNHNKHAQYILNDDFLSASAAKSYCDDSDVVHQVGEDAAVQQFLLADANVNLDDAAADLIQADDDVLYTRHVSNARKVLPHKKRISRKLRVSLSGVDNMMPPPLVGGVVNSSPEVIRLNASVYNCEICGNASHSQLQFFNHLKQHYEPTTPDTILAAMKTSLDELKPQKALDENKKASSNNDEQVFNDVHLNFPDFEDVDETSMHNVLNTVAARNDEIKNLNSNDINKCMTYVARTPSPPLKRTVEVEFSDSEDMLEGIRNVVDKVSIEDTCDALDLMTSNGIRNSWFTNDNFTGMVFKNKPFNDVSFAEPLPPMPMMVRTITISKGKTTRKDSTTLPPAEKLLAYQKSDDRKGRAALRLPSLSLPQIRLPNVNTTTTATVDDVDAEQVRCSSPPVPTTPTDLLAPLNVEPFELPVSPPTQIPPVIEDTVFCKQEPDTYEYEESEVQFENYGALEETYLATSKIAKSDVDVSDQKKFACTKCDRKFNSRNALKYHHRTHTGLRPHKCDMCNMSFYALNALKTHKRTHTGDKPYKCEHCQRDFRQWGDLKYHIISIHTAEKNHQCEYCGKSFARKYSLVLHRRIHTSERNFICEFCHKTFRASTYLQDHRKIHTGEKPYECTICAKRFRMQGDMRRHMGIHERKATKKPTSNGNEGGNEENTAVLSTEKAPSDT